MRSTCYTIFTLVLISTGLVKILLVQTMIVEWLERL
jgi:hypothetical protein